MYLAFGPALAGRAPAPVLHGGPEECVTERPSDATHGSRDGRCWVEPREDGRRSHPRRPEAHRDRSGQGDCPGGAWRHAGAMTQRPRCTAHPDADLGRPGVRGGGGEGPDRDYRGPLHRTDECGDRGESKEPTVGTHLARTSHRFFREDARRALRLDATSPSRQCRRRDEEREQQHRPRNSRHQRDGPEACGHTRPNDGQQPEAPGREAGRGAKDDGDEVRCGDHGWGMARMAERWWAGPGMPICL